MHNTFYDLEASVIMWKDSYRIGVELIDSQHKELFDTTETLIQIIESEDAVTRKQECINTVIFLQKYTAAHFSAEEGYQRSIKYDDIEAHKTLHRIFISAIDKSTQRLFDAEFTVPEIREFAGVLTTWLVYHVAGVDQKLRIKVRLPDKKPSPSASYSECFAQSAIKTLKTLAELPDGKVTYAPYSGSADDIRIMIGLIGDHKGEAVFSYSKEMSLNLIKAMTEMELNAIDELVCSALSETTNIISGNASSLIAESGKTIDITTPSIVTDFPASYNSQDSFYLDTEFGRMAISVNVV